MVIPHFLPHSCILQRPALLLWQNKNACKNHSYAGLWTLRFDIIPRNIGSNPFIRTKSLWQKSHRLFSLLYRWKLAVSTANFRVAFYKDVQRFSDCWTFLLPHLPAKFWIAAGERAIFLRKNRINPAVFRLSIFFVTSTQRASSFGLRLFFFVLAFKLFIALPKAERWLPLRYQWGKKAIWRFTTSCQANFHMPAFPCGPESGSKPCSQ